MAAEHRRMAEALMTRIEKKRWFNADGSDNRKPQKLEKSYSVSDTARIMGVSRQTVFKWLSIAEPEGAVIPPAAWWRTPGGHIRIREWVLIKLQAG